MQSRRGFSYIRKETAGFVFIRQFFVEGHCELVTDVTGVEIPRNDHIFFDGTQLPDKLKFDEPDTKPRQELLPAGVVYL